MDDRFQIMSSQETLGLICVVYLEPGNEERHVRFFLKRELADRHFLDAHIRCALTSGELIDGGVPWVDEHPFYETGVEVTIDIHCDIYRKLTEWCEENAVTMENLSYGISCFLCNPDRRGDILAYINRMMETRLKLNSELVLGLGDEEI